MSRWQRKLNMRRAVAAVAVFAMVLSIVATSFAVVAFAEDEEGVCGKELTWKYQNGTLTISGKGDMQDFTELTMAPWYHLRSEILRVVLPEGLTSVGDLAFYGCNRLASVTLPRNVLRIGHYAFAGCEKMAFIDIEEALRSIGNAAFYECLALDAVRLPYGLESIGYEAFFGCSSLSSITIPENLKKMGDSAFAYCTGLVSAEIRAPLKVLPEWAFYGCDILSVVVMPSTMEEVDNYALKNCDGLSVVYFEGNDDARDVLKDEISRDLPDFENFGLVSAGAPSGPVSSGRTEEREDGSVTRENVVMKQNGELTIVSNVKVELEPDGTSGSYSATVNVTVEKGAPWDNVGKEITTTLRDISDTYANAKGDTAKVNVYVKGNGGVGGDFMDSLSGRDVKLTVNTSDGSEWRIDCNELEVGSEQHDYSHVLSSPTEETLKQLGTDNCFGLNFGESSNMRAETVISLPSDTAYNTVHLYQIEKDGSHTLLQSVQVDADANAHFYLASVDKDTNYVIGVNVPGERTDNVIVPDELMTSYGSVYDRLNKIEYVTTGVKSSWGLGFMQVTWIMVGVLGGCIIAVGVVMTVINKKKMKKRYSAVSEQ